MTVILILLFVLPVLISMMSVTGSNRNRRRKNRIKYVIAGLVGIGIAFASMILIFLKNPVRVILNAVENNCSNTDVEKLTAAVFAASFIALVVCIISDRNKNVEKKARTRKRSILLLLVSLSAIPVFIGHSIRTEAVKQICLTEICRDAEADDDTVSGYITFTNTGSLNCDRENYYLSLNEEQLKDVELENTELKKGENFTCTVGEDDLSINEEGGSTVYLSTGDGQIIDSVRIPALAENQIYRKTGTEWEVVTAIQEKKTEEETTAVPVFSAESGYYDNEFQLTLSAPEGSVIYYTTDGSIPTENSAKYENAIRVYDRSSEENIYRSILNIVEDWKDRKTPDPVDKIFVVRALCVNADGEKSSVVTNSYIIGLEDYKNVNVISLNAEPDELFGENGIYVTGAEYDAWYEQKLASGDEAVSSEEPVPNYMKEGKEWEREVSMEYFVDGTRVTQQEAGIRILGASARKNLLKRFSLYAREEYSGSSTFDYQFFEGIDSHSLALRGGIENAVTQQMVKDRDISVQDSIPVYVFLNGELWYKTYIQEKYNTRYFSEHYNVDQDNVFIVKADNCDDTGDSERNSYESIKAFIESADFSDEECYETFCEKVDIQSYIDYMCTNIYLANMDESERKNRIMWHTDRVENETYGDGKWRWALYDMDLLQKNNDGKQYTDGEFQQMDTFTVKGEFVDTALGDQALFLKLKNNSTFCKQFVNTFMDMVNTDFSIETVTALLEEWDLDSSFDGNFFMERASYIVPYMAQAFGLTGTQEQVSVTANAANQGIAVNTAVLDIDGSAGWTGTYFTDYPITVSTQDENFDHWEVTSGGKTEEYSEMTLEIPVTEGGIEICAVFKS